MGSFQQIIMGGMCLAAVFFFGSFLHNRPASNDQGQQVQAASDPLDSLFNFGKKPAANTGVQPPVFAAPQPQIATQFAAAPASSAIDPSERAPVIAVASQQEHEQPFAPAATRKAVVPDFSELASRFRNTPLELSDNASQPRANRGVHESERVPFTGQFEAPKLVVRQPENIQPLQNFRSEVDRIEDSVRGEFSAVQPETSRWRVNRSDEIDKIPREGQFPRDRQFQRNHQFNVNQIPQQDFARQNTEPRETIEDVLSRRSADYLKDESERETWATDPPTASWTSRRRHRVTEQAGMRNQNILDIEDPGKRFRSDVNEVQEFSPPEPDLETAYYTPTKQRQDSVPPRTRRPNRQMRSIQSNVSPTQARRSNIQSQFSDLYEIQPGDTLQSISTRFYGSADYYLEIYRANRTVLDRITSSPAGVRIEIPNLNN